MRFSKTEAGRGHGIAAVGKTVNCPANCPKKTRYWYASLRLQNAVEKHFFSNFFPKVKSKGDFKMVLHKQKKNGMIPGLWVDTSMGGSMDAASESIHSFHIQWRCL